MASGTISAPITRFALSDMTTDTSVANINEEPVLGFVGGVDSPVINDFLYGFILGAQSINPDIKVDTRYTNDYVDTAIAKEYGLSMGAGEPLGSMLAALVFGLAQALGIKVSSLGADSNLVSPIPYLVTILGLVVFALVGRSRARQRHSAAALQAAAAK